jgi:hypothetical protein
VAIGNGALSKLVSGYGNTAIGDLAGTNYNGAEHDNVLINSSGTVGDTQTIRIGATNACYVGGIYNKANGPAPYQVYCGSDGKLATGVGGNAVVLAARLLNDVDDVTGDLTKYYLGTDAGGLTKPLTFYIKQGGGDYTAGAGATPATYTVPVSGAYLLTFIIRLNGLRAAIMPAPPIPPAPVYVDPIAIEMATGAATRSVCCFPALLWNGYQQYVSGNISTVEYLSANDTVKWYIEIDYRPGDNGDYSPTGQRKIIGIDGYDIGSMRYFTKVGLTLLAAY